ncbi:MAG: Pvc16 family protein [Anaerolineae bacterium]
MIDQIDRRLKAWMESVVAGPSFSLAPPGDAQAESGVSFFLLELVENAPARTSTPTPLQLSLRYLVTTWAEAPEEAHRLLGELVFAAMETSEFEVELEPVAPAIWAALGAAPRPSFILRVPLRKERPQPPVKRVRAPLMVQVAPVTSLYGVVLGPDDVPVMGAAVHMPALQISTRTDAQGRFAFHTVPAGEEAGELRVRARGREIRVTVKETTSEEAPVVVRFERFD